MPEPAISKRLLFGLGSQTYGWTVQMVVRLAEVPLLLHFWGLQLYGEWLMLAAIPVYLAIGDGGFAGAASRDMSMRSGAGDHAGALAVFQSTGILLGIVSVFVLGFAALLAEVAPLGKWFGFQEIGADELELVLLLLVSHVIVGFQGGLVNGGFWCSGRYPLGMALGSTTQLIEFAAMAGAVAFGGGPVEAAGAYLAGRVAGTVLARLGLKRATPWLHYGIRAASVREIRRLTKPAFASLAFPLGNALNIQGMRLVVGIALGPAAVAVFSPLRTLSNFATQPRLIVNRLIQPELGLAFGAGDENLFSRLFLRGSQTALWGCLLAASALLILVPWFWPVWTRSEAELHWPLFAILIGAAMVNSVWYTALMVPYATNRHGQIAVFYSTVYGAGAVLIGYLATAIAGLWGAGSALLLAEIIMAIHVLPVALKMGQQEWTTWLRTILRPPMFVLSLVFTPATNIVREKRTEWRE